MILKRTLSLVSTLFLCSFAAFSQEGVLKEEAPKEEELAPWQTLGWQSEGSGKLGPHATIEIKNGLRFLERRDTESLMQMMGNPTSGTEQGLIGTKDLDWFIVFEFTDDGYVKDDEKGDIDADKLLKTLRENDKISNEHRADAGYEQLYTEGWAKKPVYNEKTKSLEWGIIVRAASGGQSVNYITKRLGRKGVMHVTIVGDPGELDTILPLANAALDGFAYVPGATYEEYREGDKLAKYGMTALITGGALYGASKLGFFVLLKKFAKFIIIGVVAIGATFRKFFAGLFGRKAS